jgi:hypothetical protein
MKSKLFALMLLAGGSLFAETHFSIGVGVGAPGYYPGPAAVVVAGRPPYPGPGYEWVDGYYAPTGGWVAGYWAAPQRYYAPRYYAPERGYYGGSYYRGRDWDHDRGRGHEWREHERHEHEGRDRDRGWRR